MLKITFNNLRNVFVSGKESNCFGYVGSMYLEEVKFVMHYIRDYIVTSLNSQEEEQYDSICEVRN